MITRLGNEESQEKGITATEERGLESRDRKTGCAAFDRLMTFPAYRKRQTFWDIAILSVVVITLLLPVAGKAFNIDDPLFIWTARQILDHPADFYGFRVNWYGQEQPMHVVMQNPPLTSYFIALVAFLFGFGEIPLHIAFLTFAIITAIGIYLLARELCPEPLLAALAGILTPAFMVSSNTTMCDMPMLAFWIWAVVFWIYGLRKDSLFYLFVSAILICLSALNKYFGISLVPLLLAYSLVEKRTLGRWAFFLLLPIAVIGLYELATGILYGRGLFSDAVVYAKSKASIKNIYFISQGVIGLAFMGGGFISALLLVPYLWSWRAVETGLILTALTLFVLPVLPNMGQYPLREAGGDIRQGMVIQISFFAAAGMTIIAAATLDLAKRRDSASLLLFLWILGTFVFAAFVNWTTNIRSILPVAPAIGILLARRFCDANTNPVFRNKTALPVILLACAIVSFSVAWADATLANTARSAASEITKRYGGRELPLWFQGHWGFQYYMQNKGGKPIDFRWAGLEKGALVVIPTNNTNTLSMPPGLSEISDTLEHHPFRWISTMNILTGAGFYSSLYGPLPLVFGVSPPERYIIVKMTAPLY
jgi:4-amino-4-deoxy-L-arabinose transferase-like glycosyltransferase